MGVLNGGTQPHIPIRVLKRRGSLWGSLRGAPNPISLLGSLRGGVPNTLIPMGVVKGPPNPISLMGSLRGGGPMGVVKG